MRNNEKGKKVEKRASSGVVSLRWEWKRRRGRNLKLLVVNAASQLMKIRRQEGAARAAVWPDSSEELPSGTDSVTRSDDSSLVPIISQKLEYRTLQHSYA